MLLDLVAWEELRFSRGRVDINKNAREDYRSSESDSNSLSLLGIRISQDVRSIFKPLKTADYVIFVCAVMYVVPMLSNTEFLVLMDEVKVGI